MKVASAGLSYLEWAIIAGSIGGPAGVVVASLIGIPTSMLLNALTDHISGDYVVDEFQRPDGLSEDEYITYVVEHNGHGKNGTFSAYVEMLTMDHNGEYYIGDEDQCYTEETFKRKLYDDWYGLVEEDSYVMRFEEGPSEHFSKILDSFASAPTYEEGLQEFWTQVNDSAWTENSCYDIYSMLTTGYDFDLEEYYNYVNTGGLEND